MEQLTIEDIRRIKRAQEDADRKRFASMTREERAREWDNRMEIYKKLFPNRPKPGTDEWKVLCGLSK